MELFKLAKAELLRSNADRRHPFLYFTLATFGQYPEARTVVKRHAGQDLSLLFFTDSRTPKVSQIKKNAKVSALFYHPKKKLQVRMKGLAELIGKGDESYDQFLEQIKNSRALKDYTARQAPGSEVGDESEIVFGEEAHFIAIKIKPAYMDVLRLGREQHERRRYTLEGKNWEEAVLVP